MDSQTDNSKISIMIYIPTKPQLNTSVWGSLRLAPIRPGRVAIQSCMFHNVSVPKSIVYKEFVITVKV